MFFNVTTTLLKIHESLPRDNICTTHTHSLRNTHYFKLDVRFFIFFDAMQIKSEIVQNHSALLTLIVVLELPAKVKPTRSGWSFSS